MKLKKIASQLQPKRLHYTMQEKRKKGIQVRLSSHLAGLKYFPGDPTLSINKYFYDLGLQNPGSLTINQWVNIGDDEALFVLAEMVLEMVMIGVDLTFDVSDLLAVSANTTQTTITLPVIDISNVKKTYGKGKEVSMGVEFEEDHVTVGDKRVDIKTYGKTLKLPYEVLTDTPFDIVSVYYIGYGAALAADKLSYFAYIVINGDGGVDRDKNVVEDSIGTIGVEDTAKGIQFRDINKASIRLSKKGRLPETAMIDELESYDILELPEYKERKQGIPDIPIKIKGQYKTPDEFYFTDDEVGTKSMVCLSKRFCTGQFTKEALHVDTELIKARRLSALYVWERSGMMNIFRDARIRIDGTKEWASNKFPAFLAIRKTK